MHALYLNGFQDYSKLHTHKDDGDNIDKILNFILIKSPIFIKVGK